MTQDKKPIFSKVKYGALALSAVAAIAFLTYSYISYTGSQGPKEFSSSQKKAFGQPEFQLIGLEAYDLKELKLVAGKTIVPLAEKDGIYSISEDAEKTPVYPPYTLSVSLIEGTRRLDLEIDIGVAGKDVKASTDGFSSEDTLTMKFGDHVAFDRMKMDWSGKTEASTLLFSDVPMPLCVIVTDGKRNISVCHAFPNGWAA